MRLFKVLSGAFVSLFFRQNSGSCSAKTHFTVLSDASVSFYFFCAQCNARSQFSGAVSAPSFGVSKGIHTVDGIN